MTINWLRPFEQADCYYVVGEQKTYNKNQAIAWANGDLSKIYLYWLDEVWDNIDLSVRPTASWSDLMKQRCQQIRDKSTEFVISYSAGYDSQTILDHCIANNILVDELQTNRKTYILHPEAEEAVKLAELAKNQHYPKLKISMVDIDIDYMSNIYKQNKDNWLFMPDTSEIIFTKQYRSNLINRHPGFAKKLEIIGRTVVEGHEKPRVLIQNNQWVMSMPDSLMGLTMNTAFENFYISRELPELHIKQLWMMIDWLESIPVDSVQELEAFLHSVQKQLDNQEYQQWNAAVGRTPVSNYISWDCNLNHKYAPRGGLYSFDTNATIRRNSLENSMEFKIWESAATEFVKNYQSAFETDQGYKQVWSKWRPIKPVEINKNKNKTKITV